MTLTAYDMLFDGRQQNRTREALCAPPPSKGLGVPGGMGPAASSVQRHTGRHLRNKRQHEIQRVTCVTASEKLDQLRKVPFDWRGDFDS